MKKYIKASPTGEEDDDLLYNDILGIVFNFNQLYQNINYEGQKLEASYDGNVLRVKLTDIIAGGETITKVVCLLYLPVLNMDAAVDEINSEYNKKDVENAILAAETLEGFCYIGDWDAEILANEIDRDLIREIESMINEYTGYEY